MFNFRLRLRLKTTLNDFGADSFASPPPEKFLQAPMTGIPKDAQSGIWKFVRTYEIDDPF